MHAWAVRNQTIFRIELFPNFVSLLMMGWSLQIESSNGTVDIVVYSY